jgi:hypothetical protein
VSAGNEAASKDDGRQIRPAVGCIFADEGELFQKNAAGSLVVMPALAGERKGRACGLLSTHLGDGQVGDIGPLFLEFKHLGIEFLVEIAHPRSIGVDSYVYGRRHRNKGLDGAEGDLKRLLLSADLVKKLQSGSLRTVQWPRGQDGEMGGEVRKIGMQLPAEALDEFSRRISQVGYQRITELLHLGEKLYRELEEARFMG